MTFPASVKQQCDDLARLLGLACSPYLWETFEPSLVAEDQPGRLSAYSIDTVCKIDEVLATHAVEQAARTRNEALVDVERDASVFAIPLVGNGLERWFAVGGMDEPASDSGRRLLRVAGEAVRRQYVIQAQSQALSDAENALERACKERTWLKQLSAERAMRKRTVGLQSRQAMESLRGLIDAEAIAIYVYSDRDCEKHGLEPLITGTCKWTLDDIRGLLQRIQKPRLGDSVLLHNVEIQLPNGTIRSCAVVPVGESDASGYVVAINRRLASITTHGNMENNDVRFSSEDSELLHEVAGYLSSVGYGKVHLQENEQLVLGTLQAMSNAIEARDPYTRGHSERVANVAYQIAVRLQLSEVSRQEIYLAGVLHDIGKIGIPDYVLMKPDKLEPEEFAIIQKHPEIGHRILEELGKLRFALPGVLHHHERYDGTGYPHRLAKQEIPLMARILAVSDAYDAMTSSRVYRGAMNRQRAIGILGSGVGTQWDRDVVDVCIEFIAEVERNPLESNLESTRATPVQWRHVSQALRTLQL